MTDRSGIEIDYCPQCRGVWLDRGELDKIIERSVVAPAAQPGVPQPGVPQQPFGVQQPYQDPGYGYGGKHGGGHGGGHNNRNRRGWLGQLFD